MNKPVFRPLEKDTSNSELEDLLLPILYPHLDDLIGFRYDLFTHRHITTSIMLAKNYVYEDVRKYIDDINNMKVLWIYLTDLYSISHQIPDDGQTELYIVWHEASRHVTDHLCEDDQPGRILKHLLAEYDRHFDYKHTIFTEDSTLFLEDYI